MTNHEDQEARPITRYVWEYRNFLEFVQKGKPERAVIYAKALGIDRRTLVHWMSQPELRDALISSIDKLVDGMQTAGKGDWKMYRELLDILGVNKETSIDVTSNGKPVTVAMVQFIDGTDDTDQDDQSQDPPTV